jgi:AmmeMemoRadiSam system protein B/AmmeMemoRadiSam system protein A
MRILLATLLCVMACSAGASVRPAAVAGGFYPGDAEQLRHQVDSLLAAAETGGEPPLALVVPHAGYVYSGATAAKGFAALRGARVRRVILLGPSHHEGFSGAALPARGVTAFATPLGSMPLDKEALATLRGTPEFTGPASAHGPEHCLEVELPFLQRVVPQARLVPVLLGARTSREQCRDIAERIASLLDPETVVVVSTDFTHHGRAFGFAPFAPGDDLGERLLALARSTAGRAAAVDPDGFWQQVHVSGDTVCGRLAVGVLTEVLAHAFDGRGRVVDVTTSGHVSGDWSRVVSYATVRFDGSWRAWQENARAAELGTLTEQQGQALLALARAAFRTELAHDASLADWYAENSSRDWGRSRAGAFVTLHNRGARARTHGRLRACMGVIQAREPLVDAVIHAAVSASHDPRFPELSLDELDQVHLEVSVLSPTRRVSSAGEIEVGTHGVVLHKGRASAVFLPQVAPEQGWDRDTMLAHLSRKAGLSSEAWRSGAEFDVFTAQVFAEEE